MPVDVVNKIVLAAAITFVVMVLLFVFTKRTHPEDARVDWWHLAVDLDAASRRLGNEPDRQFIREMINELAADPDATPSPAKQRWLLSIKRELEGRRRPR
jgi:hypothetical protein